MNIAPQDASFLEVVSEQLLGKKDKLRAATAAHKVP